MTTLYDFIQRTTWEGLPLEVQRQARRCLLDTLGVALAGRATEVSRIIHDYVAETFAPGSALLWQDGRRVVAPGAALANATTIDALDAHDGHSLTKGHPGAAIVAAALALAAPDCPPLPGRELLVGLAIGYEVALRAGIALHATAADYHSSGAWNALGCAALAARRLGQSEMQTLHALGIAEYHAPRSPIMRCVEQPTMVKDGSGWGALIGLSAAQLADKGFTGRPAALIESDAVRPYWEGLGQDWEMLHLYFKPHAVCRWAQPAVEAALQLQGKHRFEAADIVAVQVQTFHEATRLAVRSPHSTEEAQYSLPFAVAAALVGGTLGSTQLTGPALADPRILRLAALVQLSEDADLSACFPARRFAHMTITTRDQRRFEARHVEPLWDPSASPSDEELLAKFRWLTQDLPADKAQRLEQLLLTCADLPDVAGLVEEASVGFPSPALPSPNQTL